MAKVRQGWTLLELILVMAVMAIAITLVTPVSIRLLRATDLTQATQSVASHLMMARAEAVQHQTLVRLVIPQSSPDENGGAYQRMSLWRWDQTRELFYRTSEWVALPDGVIFEPVAPDYIKESTYAKRDPISVYGDYLLTAGEEPWMIEYSRTESDELPARFIEFLPTGRARVPEGDQPRIILTLVEGFEHPPGSGKMVRANELGDRIQMTPKERQGQDRSLHASKGSISNWAQVNVLALTGKVRVYRP